MPRPTTTDAVLVHARARVRSDVLQLAFAVALMLLAAAFWLNGALPALIAEHGELGLVVAGAVGLFLAQDLYRSVETLLVDLREGRRLRMCRQCQAVALTLLKADEQIALCSASHATAPGPGLCRG